MYTQVYVHLSLGHVTNDDLVDSVKRVQTATIVINCLFLDIPIDSIAMHPVRASVFRNVKHLVAIAFVWQKRTLTP